ncbi:UNKNOWN [Stylonychia lemnae]|uniref:Transmembrane protein n=1 Tax=Stylonychia lemnae TaxID=5949 RepID=A0A078B7X8_STYLE|nr:UNKNOWN [Stylonychia lemnae]|eukprot:CDW90499.1 UNKNOWN [Stylonychia lemnae]
MEAVQSIQRIIVQASRSSINDSPLSTPGFSWMSSQQLMYLRGFLLLFDVLIGGNALSITGIAKFPFYLSPQGVVWSILTEYLLFASHFRTFDQRYENLVKAMFEMSTIIQTLITVYYWTLLYKPGKFDFKNIVAWQLTVMMHVTPILTMFIEMIFNNIIFDWKKGWLRVIYPLIVYCPMQIFAKDIMGKNPYGSIDLTKMNFYIFQAIVLVATIFMYFTIAFVNNLAKSGSGSSLNDIKQLVTQDYKYLVDLI